MTQKTMLSTADFLHVISRTPLVAIDLIVKSDFSVAGGAAAAAAAVAHPAEPSVLVGLRCNAPARDFWFVPGGRVRKDEPLDVAFARLVKDELGLAQGTASRSQAKFIGVFEHFYPENVAGIEEFGTHYVTLAYELASSSAAAMKADLPPEQHSEYKWLPLSQLRMDPQVHPYTKAYFGPAL